MNDGKNSIMRLLAFGVLAMVLTAWSVMGVPQFAFACSCMEGGTVAESLADATAVFSGRVTDIAANDSRENATFTVFSAWKGDIGETVAVETSGNDGMCGYGFEMNSEYLVFAYGEGNSLSTGICSMTVGLSTSVAQERIDELDVLSNPSSPTSSNFEGPFAKVVVAFVAFVVGFAVAKVSTRK